MSAIVSKYTNLSMPCKCSMSSRDLVRPLIAYVPNIFQPKAAKRVIAVRERLTLPYLIKPIAIAEKSGAFYHE